MPSTLDIEAEALQLLEWGRLGQQLAQFAGSVLGRKLCEAIPLAPNLEEARRRLEETAEILGLDGLLEGGLSFVGVQTQLTQCSYAPKAAAAMVKPYCN